MKTKAQIIEILKKHTSSVFAKDILYPSEFDAIASEIEAGDKDEPKCHHNPNVIGSYVGCPNCDPNYIPLNFDIQPSDAKDEQKAISDDKPCNKCEFNGHSSPCEQCNPNNDYEHFVYRDPYSKESKDFYKLFIKARKELCAISPTKTYALEDAIRKAFDELQSQPTVSLPDEMETCIDLDTDKITLHKQPELPLLGKWKCSLCGETIHYKDVSEVDDHVKNYHSNNP